MLCVLAVLAYFSEGGRGAPLGRERGEGRPSPAGVRVGLSFAGGSLETRRESPAKFMWYREPCGTTPGTES
jgi:hypothetical protein